MAQGIALWFQIGPVVAATLAQWLGEPGVAQGLVFDTTRQPHV